ncbi:MAG: hypothetical protein ACLQVN_22785 [Bryobacteraceae bacterium]
MSPRTCQLCGKPLSRIWVGAGGDFCSREHRNQYQLRQGMDRLLEASQVANLMRRRETPKPILAGSIESTQPLLHRGFFELKPVLSSRKQDRVWPRAQPVTGRRQKPGCERLRAPAFAQRVSRRGAEAEARPVGRGKVRWGVNRGPQLRPAPGRRVTVALQNAPAAAVRFDVLGSMPRYRCCDLLRQKLRAAQLPAFEAGKPGGSKTGAIPCAGALVPDLAAVEGERRPVSVEARFRAARARLREFAAPRPAAAMIWPEELLNGFPAGISMPSMVRLAESRLAADGVRWPASPSPDDVHGFAWPEFLASGGSQRDCRMDGRTAAAVWRMAERDALPPPLDLCPLANPSWQAGLRRVPLLAPLAPHGVPQLSLVPIEPQEPAFDYSPIRLEVAAAVPCAPEAPPRVAARTRQRLEENFDAGLGNWVGDLSEWKVDAAGAHTGGLALFVPSIELIDYDFEFLARMEGRSLTWVFRAEEMTDYHAASLAIGADGSLVFNRWSVIGDAAGARFTKPLGIRLQEQAPAGKSKKAPPRKAVTIVTRVNGHQFSVSLDGQPVDRWTDNRLSIGGIGFASTPEDRARIYWVHITSLEMPAKEHHRA